jgi:uncharacterized membrane protein
MTWAHFSSDHGAVIVVVGAICFWAIDKFANDHRLAQLLKLLVVLICLGAILQRMLPLIGLPLLIRAEMLASVLHRHRRQSEHLDVFRFSMALSTALPLFAAWVQRNSIAPDETLVLSKSHRGWGPYPGGLRPS